MKKLFAAVFLISIFAIAGCASDSSNSSAQAPVEEPLIPADPNNPSTLIGHYKVDYFGILQGGTIVSTDCNQAKNDLSNSATCNEATFLANLADIQMHNEGGKNIYSFVIQMQLDSPEISGGTLNEHAYHHLFFPIPESNISKIQDNIGNGFNTRATERGLTSFFLSRPLGGQGDTNGKVTTLIKDGDQLFVKMHEYKNTSVFYAVRLTKTSNKSNNYVTTNDTQGKDIIYAVSSRFNELIQSTFEDDALKTLFNGFKNDFPNTPGDPITK